MRPVVVTWNRVRTELHTSLLQKLEERCGTYAVKSFFSLIWRVVLHTTFSAYVVCV